jgi:alcohol dehydrogenase
MTNPLTMKSTGVGLGDLAKSFPFLLPTRIEFGLGVAERVAEEAAQFGTRALIVSDPGVERVGLVAAVHKRLDSAGFDVQEYTRVEANPRVATVDEVAGVARNHNSDVIVAIGGGSAIDTAKAASAVARHGGTILDYEGLDRVPGPGIPVVAIPTTAGTGSEVTLWAIVTDTVRQFKAPIGSFHLAPRVALVDPLTTVTLPAGLTASTGIDALTHAIEAYTARCSNSISDALVLYAIELISTFLEPAVAQGDDLEARSAMMLGSLLAGIGFGNADTAAVHSMAEALGAVFDVPHGTANAIFLPFVMDHNVPAALERTARIGVAMGLDTGSLALAASAAAAVTAVRDLTHRLGIPSLADLGITDADLPKLAATAMMNSGTPDNPVEMDAASFQQLFSAALHAGARS